MANNKPHRLSIELDASAGPIKGQLHACGYPTLTFVGWLSLIGALERRLITARDGHVQDKLDSGVEVVP